MSVLEPLFPEGPDAKTHLSFILKSGRRVWLTGFMYGITYDGLLIGGGRAREEDNLRFIAMALHIAETVWSKPTFLIKPVKENPNDGPFWMPRFRCMARLISSPIMSRYAKSALVVVWFADDALSRPLQDLLPQVLYDLDWESHAMDDERRF